MGIFIYLFAAVPAAAAMLPSLSCGSSSDLVRRRCRPAYTGAVSLYVNNVACGRYIYGTTGSDGNGIYGKPW